MHCTKTIIDHHWGGGKLYRNCLKPIYKDDLCAKHYKSKQYKSTNWEDRDNYREATPDDLTQGRSLKRKNTNQNNNFFYRGGNTMKMFSNKQNKFIDTNLPTDPAFFCVKI